MFLDKINTELSVLFVFKKTEKTGWFRVVGFGDILRGRRESVLKINVLQTFPPNPSFLVLFFALRDYKALKASNHLL
jgi:hypothetical protein